MTGISVTRLAGRRLHVQHGPIDLLIDAGGPAERVDAAEQAMLVRFSAVLDELVSELTTLRGAIGDHPVVDGTIARRMVAATAAHALNDAATPMIAVAGAVADEIADIGWAVGGLDRLVVNNGGDIAIRQQHGDTTVVGVVDDLATGRVVGRLHVDADSGVGGVATSGLGGRSLSLGIADSVTVLAASAAEADVVATLVANAVDLPGHPAIIRRPARQIRDDTDLVDALVAVEVGQLSQADVSAALDRGAERARRALRSPRVSAAVLCLRQSRRIVRSASSDERALQLL